MLNFSVFFQESVVENANENYRLRKCTMYYYLEDDTIHILETRVPNSGIPQGIFLKRHLVPKVNSIESYTWKDLAVGSDIEFYGRFFRIIDCDEFTRAFYADQGITQAPAEALPNDPFQNTRAMVGFRQNPPDRAEVKEYIEVQLKGGRPNKNLKSFLDNDRKVLSFAILWQDDSYDGGAKYYRLNFFLSDNTIEVKEILRPNNGCYPFSMLLRRQKLARVPKMSHYPGLNLREVTYYMPEDLKCGDMVTVWGRQCLIYDIDDFTKTWYQRNCQMEQRAVALPKPSPDVFYQAVPPETGYGTAEDSMASVIALQPKPPKFDMKKKFKQDMHVMRFNAKLVSTEPDDESRTFIISFFCGDDTLQVYEVCDKNSGRIGGRFMERKKQRNPVSGNYYAEKDFTVGRTVALTGFKFMLMSSDHYTEKYMADNGNEFPEAAQTAILNKLMAPARNFPSVQAYCEELFKQFDTNQDGSVVFGEFAAGLARMGINITPQEQHVLMRRFDTNRDGKISLSELVACLQ